MPRPKNSDATPAATAVAAETTTPLKDETPVKRGRGRPKGSIKVKRDENGKPIPGTRIDSASTTTTTTTSQTSTASSTATGAKRKAEDDGIVRTGKRGRPKGTGKKQVLARKIKSLQAEDDEDSDDGVMSLKVIIERW